MLSGAVQCSCPCASGLAPSAHCLSALPGLRGLAGDGCASAAQPAEPGAPPCKRRRTPVYSSWAALPTDCMLSVLAFLAPCESLASAPPPPTQGGCAAPGSGGVQLKPQAAAVASALCLVGGVCRAWRGATLAAGFLWQRLHAGAFPGLCKCPPARRAEHPWRELVLQRLQAERAVARAARKLRVLYMQRLSHSPAKRRARKQKPRGSALAVCASACGCAALIAVGVRAAKAHARKAHGGTACEW